MARKKIIAGNWKMNKTPSEAVALVEELKPLDGAAPRRNCERKTGKLSIGIKFWHLLDDGFRLCDFFLLG